MLDGVRVYPALSLAESHSTLHVGEQLGRRLLFIQADDGSLVARLLLDADDLTRWRGQVDGVSTFSEFLGLGSRIPTRKDIQGVEYDWLAVDSEGVVGILSTAGGGLVPDAVLQNIDAFEPAIDTVLALPACTSADCTKELSADLTNTWRLVAERGLFAFDSDYCGGPYERIATPHNPVMLEDLPESVREVVRKVVLRNVRFRTAKEITAAAITT
ncbi:hypothetical protein AKJ09_11115 [Labilithrix luteola]|uniref:Uncharacterized protein n=1 Tax=Labilithrix luteola TaxID=1391654 RepID=A0A0K1QFL7_9BACT|nr:hypothetical protein [Labilithrix luteola]AKV04452.1 hypothetical protein AKJ09_11115 [Labilithrix luteola]